jgi:hypothetical protein
MKERPMTSHTASIERSNRKHLHEVELQVTPQETSRHTSWTGVFMSRSSDGFMPDERLALTLENGLKRDLLRQPSTRRHPYPHHRYQPLRLSIRGA